MQDIAPSSLVTPGARSSSVGDGSEPYRQARPGAASSSAGHAGSFPTKRGEIGYEEPTPPEPAHIPSSRDVSTTSALPATHPAERPSTDANAGASNDNASAHSGHSTHSKLLRLLKPKRIPSLFGVRLSTLGLFLLHVIILTGTIAGWALLVQHLSEIQGSSDNSSGLGSSSSTIFVHVAFGVACLAQLIFLERRIYRIRAERYFHAHGSDLPMHTRRGEMGMGLAPWNRPPLPTYAAALAQSGVGTGDVEDSAIAIPPPPAYGHTRGSTLLLSGFMTDTLRAQRHQARDRVRQAADSAENRGSRRSTHASWTTQDSRPVSYVSRDEEWEERSDRLRAVKLEETLARLEDARSRE